jgi:hypothetical protein
VAQTQPLPPGRGRARPGPRQDVYCGRLERLELGFIVSRPQMLDFARPTPRRVHNLHRRRPGRGHRRAHVRSHDQRLRARLVRKSGRPSQQTPRSARCRAGQAPIVSQVRMN